MRRGLASSIALAGLLAAAGCRTPVVIETDPPGAALYCDGKYIGETPVAIKAMGTQYVRGYNLRLEKAGYVTLEHRLEREQALIMGSYWPERVVLPLEKKPAAR